MKAKELIYNLRKNFEHSGSSIVNALDQHIMYMLDEARSTFAAQKMDAKVNVDHMTQTHDWKPTRVSLKELGTIGISTVYKVTIPKPISTLGGNGIFTIGSTDGKEAYEQVSYGQLKTVTTRKYTSKNAKWFFINGSVYIINVPPEAIRTIRVRAIFDEPWRIASLLPNYSVLDPFNFEYPLSMRDTKSIYGLALSGDMSWGDSAVQAINKQKQSSNNANQLLSALKDIGNAKK